MKRQKVNSSAIQEIGYEKGVLEIVFTHRGTFQYKGVGKEEYTLLMSSPSIGEAFNKLIRPYYKSIQI
jgi:hypothetical protein